MKTFLSIVVGILVLIAFYAACFGLQFAGLHWNGFFAKERANIERQVYEESKSYTHGKATALAKHYQEYMKADSVNKAIITNVIRMEFGAFDENKLTNPTLRAFLISVRGY